MARRFRRRGDKAPAIVNRGLLDSSDYVRGQAEAASSDLKFFLAIRVTGEPDEDEPAEEDVSDDGEHELR